MHVFLVYLYTSVTSVRTKHWQQNVGCWQYVWFVILISLECNGLVLITYLALVTHSRFTGNEFTVFFLSNLYLLVHLEEGTQAMTYLSRELYPGYILYRVYVNANQVNLRNINVQWHVGLRPEGAAD